MSVYKEEEQERERIVSSFVMFTLESVNHSSYYNRNNRSNANANPTTTNDLYIHFVFM